VSEVCFPICLALPKLYDDVDAFLKSENCNVSMSFGWREPARHRVTDARLVWVPGDVTGDAGELLPARSPGRNPRPIATLREAFHVRVEGKLVNRNENERAQYQVTRELFDLWWKAVYRSAFGTVTLQSLEWDISKTERRHGAALIATATVESMIPDSVQSEAPADAGADITVEKLDVTELIQVS